VAHSTSMCQPRSPPRALWGPLSVTHTLQYARVDGVGGCRGRPDRWALVRPVVTVLTEPGLGRPRWAGGAVVGVGAPTVGLGRASRGSRAGRDPAGPMTTGPSLLDPWSCQRLLLPRQRRRLTQRWARAGGDPQVALEKLRGVVGGGSSSCPHPYCQQGWSAGSSGRLR